MSKGGRTVMLENYMTEIVCIYKFAVFCSCALFLWPCNYNLPESFSYIYELES